jgi:uncharacterized protein involved in copper resistance
METPMIDFTALKNFDLKQLDPTKIDLTKFDVRNMELPKFDMPKFDMPKFDMPKFDMPKFDMPGVDKADFDKLAEFARDAAYVGIGAAVVAVKKADAQRRELTDQVTTQVRKLVDAVA